MAILAKNAKIRPVPLVVVEAVADPVSAKEASVVAAAANVVVAAVAVDVAVPADVVASAAVV